MDKQADRCIGRFSEGLASITLDGRDGYIDREGRMVIPPRYCSGREFRNGLALVYEGCDRAGEYKAGYIDAKGNWVIPPDLAKGSEFREAQVAVAGSRDRGQVLIDRTGAVIRELESDMAVDWTGFHAGLATATRIRPDILVHVDGRVLELPADLQVKHYDERAGVFVGKLRNEPGVGLLDAQLRSIGEERFTRVSAFNGDAAAAEDLWDLIGADGKRRTPFQAALNDDTSTTRKDDRHWGRWGLIGADGKRRTPFQYSQLDAVAPGLWLARRNNGPPMLIDAHGRQLEEAVHQHSWQPFGPWFVHRPDEQTIELVRSDGKRIKHVFGSALAYIVSFEVSGPLLKVQMSKADPKQVWSAELIDREGRRLLPPAPNGKSNFFNVEPVWALAADGDVALPLALLHAHTLDDERHLTSFDPDALGIVTASGAVRMNPQWLGFPHNSGGLEGPVVVQAAEGYGVIDGEGEWLAQPIYERLGPFQQGWATAERGGKDYLVKADGREYEVPEFAREPPREGFYALTIHDDESPWGPANFYDLAAGRFLFEEGLDDVEPFRNGLAPARKGQAWGLVDGQGNWRVPAACTSIYWWQKAGLWRANCGHGTDGKDSLLTKDGIALTAEPWRTLLLAHHGAEPIPPMGVAAVLGNGAALHSEMIGSAGAIGGGWAHVSLQKMAGYVDARGDWAIAPTYRMVDNFSPVRRVARVDDGRDYFLIDSDGRRVFGPSDFIGDVSNMGDDGLFYVQERDASRTEIHQLGTGRLFDIPGDHIHPRLGDGRIVYTNDVDPEDIVLDLAGRRILTAAGRNTLSSYAEGLALFEHRGSGHFSYIDRDGKSAFPGSYLYATLFREGRAVVMDEQGYRLIDQQGNTVVRVGEECGREVLLDPKGRRTWPAADEPVCHQRMD